MSFPNAYTPGVPNATDTIPGTQAPIQNNFISINQQFSGPGSGLFGDHYPLTASNSNSGRHNRVGFVTQSLPSSLASGPTLACQAVVISSVTKDELFIIPTTGQASTVQLTNVRKGTGTATGTPSGFTGSTYYSMYSFLPSPSGGTGFVIMSGNVLIGAYGGAFTNVPVVFPIAFTSTSTLSVVVTGLRGTTTDSNPVNVSDLTTTGFTIRSNSNSYKGYSWTAIGT